MTNNFKPICMSEEYWANSQFSIVRHYGHIQIGSHTYVIVNKEGKDIFELSIIAAREGRQKAIEAGEPCDLCRKDFIQFYRQLGRDKFLAILKDNSRSDEKQLKKLYKAAVEEVKAETKAKAAAQKAKELSLF